MIFHPCEIQGAWVIDPAPHVDKRGRFLRAWCQDEFAEHGIDFAPVQANMGLSILKGTIRGLHYQMEPALEAKLVRCTRGPFSMSRWTCALLPPRIAPGTECCLARINGRMLLVPEGSLKAAGNGRPERNALHGSAVYSPMMCAVLGTMIGDWHCLANRGVSNSDQDRSWRISTPLRSGQGEST